MLDSVNLNEMLSLPILLVITYCIYWVFLVLPKKFKGR
jgi:hypothetical protein